MRHRTSSRLPILKAQDRDSAVYFGVADAIQTSGTRNIFGHTVQKWRPASALKSNRSAVRLPYHAPLAEFMRTAHTLRCTLAEATHFSLKMLYAVYDISCGRFISKVVSFLLKKGREKRVFFFF